MDEICYANAKDRHSHKTRLKISNKIKAPGINLVMRQYQYRNIDLNVLENYMQIQMLANSSAIARRPRCRVS